MKKRNRFKIEWRANTGKPWLGFIKWLRASHLWLAIRLWLASGIRLQIIPN